MRPSILRLNHPLIGMCLAFVLICQTARQIEGYPHRSPFDLSIHDYSSNPAGTMNVQSESSSRRYESHDISRLIETAYENRELLRPGQWSRNNGGKRNSRPVQRDTSRYQDTHTAFVSLKRSKEDTDEDSSADASMQSDGKIVFPTDDGMIHQMQEFNPQPAPICRNSTFCEHAPYYPRDLINVAIQRNESLKFLAGTDISDIVQRIDAADETPLCESTEQVVYPQSAENKRKEWLFVVNQDNFKQGIRIEICSKEDHECKVIEGFSEGYITTCKQRFIYRQLAAIASDGNVISDTFRFPSSCCCHVKFTGNPLLRLGAIEERNNQTAVRRKRK